MVTPVRRTAVAAVGGRSMGAEPATRARFCTVTAIA
jgi:hypothetical protein